MPLTMERIKLIRRLLQRQMMEPLKKLISQLRPGDISELLAILPPGERRVLLTAMYFQKAAGHLLSDLPEGMLKDVLSGLPDEHIVRIVSTSHTDDAATIIGHLSEDRQEKILARLPAQLRDRIEEIMRYPSDVCGAIMNTDFLSLNEKMTVDEALQQLREWNAEAKEPIYTLYAVDDLGHLVGVVPIRLLAVSEADAMLREFMIRDPIYVRAYDTIQEASDKVLKYDLVALPVVDDTFTLLGVITVDDIMDAVLESASEDAYHLQGITSEDRVESPVIQSYRSRVSWTLLNLVTAFIASTVVGLFESTIQKYVVLASFMPIVAGVGGNCASQAVGVMIRGLALGEVDFAHVWRPILKQVAIGVLLGLSAGGITAVAAFLLHSNPYLGLVVFLAMLVNMTIAGLVGGGVPLLLKLLRQDPAIGSSVLVTAVTDSMGYLVLFSIASMFMSKLG